MKRSRKIILWVLAVIIALPIIILVRGWLASPEHQGTKTAIIEASSEDVWRLLDDTKRFSNSRHEVDSMQFLPLNALGKKQWVEYVGFWGTMQYEVVREIPGQLLEIRLKESGFGMTGTWVFELKPLATNQTEVTITENSRNDGLLMRSILATLGRNANMGLLLSAVKKNSTPTS